MSTSLPMIIASAPGDRPTVITGTTHQMSNRNASSQPSYVVIVTVGLMAFMVLTATTVPLVLLYQRVSFLEQKHLQTSSSETFYPEMDILNSNGTDETQQPQQQYHHSLWRRNTHDITTITPFNYPSTNGGQLSTMIHVAGNQIETYYNNDWITWMSVDGPSSLSIERMPFIHSKFIIIPRSGFYYLYTQITYRDIQHVQGAHHAQIGHDVIRQSNCGNGARDGESHQQALLKSYVTQPINFTAKDSAYVGGVFYLSQNDRIGVRTKTDGASNYRILSGADSHPLCFFGAYMLASDPAYDDRVEDDCCCMGS